MNPFIAFLAGVVTATVALFAVAHVVAGRRPRSRPRVLPVVAATPVRVWYEQDGRMVGHDLDAGEGVRLIAADHGNVTIVDAHPDQVYVAPADEPQYQG